jgi:cytochrome c oxidase subunit 2
MRGKVIIEEQGDFDTWLASQPTYADTLAVVAGDADTGKAQYGVCAACHGFEGEGNQLLNAPKLAGQEGWYIRQQLDLYKRGIRGSHKDDIYGQQMAPLAATLPNDAAVNNVIAYLDTLPDTPAPKTISGDVARGKELYENCAICHGKDGHGIWSQNAPRAAGMSDWYLHRQLKDFQDGIRGAHPRDPFGLQMSLMADTLQNDQAIDDVIAYINTL